VFPVIGISVIYLCSVLAEIPNKGNTTQVYNGNTNQSEHYTSFYLKYISEGTLHKFLAEIPITGITTHVYN
jgi:hypothetical protein